MELHELVDERTKAFSPALIAGALRTTKAEIADTLGLSRDALSRTARINAVKTQTRLREMVEIGGMTADELVREGNAAYVHAYLDHVMAGGYA